MKQGDVVLAKHVSVKNGLIGEVGLNAPRGKRIVCLVMDLMGIDDEMPDCEKILNKLGWFYQDTTDTKAQRGPEREGL